MGREVWEARVVWFEEGVEAGEVFRVGGLEARDEGGDVRGAGAVDVEEEGGVGGGGREGGEGDELDVPGVGVLLGVVGGVEEVREEGVFRGFGR